jgi:chromosome segregation protein
LSQQPDRRGRLTSLNVVGFKSFAERTRIEFGPGISAIVGPNGSGKSNLADALRWTLGEQGRMLRTRRAEDVIFAGSSARRAIGMADVTLVLDNTDRLLPVDFGEVEISRRLYRSGENDYLLNRQRVRLRDLVDLLDAGNLADNAFLFIGQGMVDQALALRPEERRPLFEEAAGVRRHERRRRRAESELEQAAANLERVDDLLAELRPQARRLAAQAEQLRARHSAGHDLAQALVLAGHARWHAAAAAAREHQQRVERARAEADTALRELRAAEATIEQLSGVLAEHAEAERDARARLEAQRAETVEMRLADARLGSELTAAEREHARLTADLETARRRLEGARRRLALPLPQVDLSLRAQLDELDRAMEAGDAATESASLRQRLATVRQQLLDARSAATAVEQQLSAQRAALAELEAVRDKSAAELAGAVAAEAAAQEQLAAATAVHEAARERRAVAANAASVIDGELGAARARLAALDATVGEQEDDGLLRAARARGAALVGEGLEIDAPFRRAVEAALGEALRGVVTTAADALELRQRQGTIILDAAGARQGREGASAEALLSAVRAAGGGLLADAVMRDPGGHVGRLLRRCAWVPTLEQVLELHARMPAGWRLVTTAGELLDQDGVLRLSSTRSLLDQRAARDDQARVVDQLEPRLAESRATLEQAIGAEQVAAAAADASRQALEAARRERREAEQGDQAAQRRLERAARDGDWLQQQLDNTRASAAAHEAGAQAIEARLAAIGSASDPQAGDAAGRREELLRRRAGLAERVAADQERLDQARSEHQRAAATLSVYEPRSAELEREIEQLTVRRADLAADRERTLAGLAAAAEREAAERAALDRLLASGSDDRGSLLAAEREANAARERLRASESASRASELAAVEKRLQLEQVRESLLVELAGIGADALLVLGGAEAAEADGLEALVELATERWAAQPPPEPAPGATRLATLRRRFTELGAGNPFAAQEYDEIHQRLAELETQRADLTAAIDATRRLMTELGALINEQFRTTFAALEDAFARRFEQLFGGGDAQLLLTTPDDLATTGVEISARPPGKKHQPLGMLSGGERALTAVALLLAMLEVRPVPFCVLDEVDAALDESNVGRFSAALRGLSDRIQFIVITHNRSTIEAADALYGVTIGDDAVSRVVSLRLPPPGVREETATDSIPEPALS